MFEADSSANTGGSICAVAISMSFLRNSVGFAFVMVISFGLARSTIFLHRLNENEDWRAIFGPKSKRLRDVETILRFLAFYEDQDTYSSPMKHFLNDYMKRKRHDSDEQLVPLQNVFMSTMRFVSQTLGERPFRPDRALNVAVFDAVSTSIAHMLQGEQQPDAEDVERVYAELLENEQFKLGYTQATADEENICKEAV